MSAIVDAARLAVVELTLHYIGDGDRALIHAAASATAAAGGGQDLSQAVRDALYYHNWDSGAEGGSEHQSKKTRYRPPGKYSSWGDEGAQGKGRGKGNGGKGKGKTPDNGDFGDPGHYGPSPDQGFGQHYWDDGDQGGGKGWNGHDNWGWGLGPWGGDGKGGKGSGKGGRGQGGNF